ncbi:NAD(P)/FAD-dependent oxidoreductase [Halococcoides cellulosivorans]|uniref:Pyridine nucleotide-disulfide oxidoreductase n=1 Tax=Halococcoides cellulosivorans TaxID=1679096 RepID=A0A2R4WY49_9EURY|nr:FAD-dependent oxidoreductase [Halococcoides cellulosivorans]AWB26465.1 pyridine nucleotide-disulfide oxidoreductase [Halococcoides cellulosivorans]
MSHVVIVGGGTGGTVLANRLVDALADPDAHRITVINDGPEQTYKPAFLYVAFDELTVADARRPIRELLDRRVEFVEARVTDVATDAHALTLADGTRLDYDELVLATGTGVDLSTVEGLAEGGHQFYDPDGARALREALAAFDGGDVVVSVIGTPHMCPAAPVEVTLMVEDWLDERGLREESSVTYTYPINRTHGMETLAAWTDEQFDERDIDAETFFNAERVDPEAQVIESMEGTALEYDLLITIPPHTGSALVRESGLGENGWIDVDRHTLEVTGVEDVHAIGDVADVPTSKAGSVAHYEAGVVAKRLRARLDGRTPSARYHGKTVCFVESGLDEATFVEFSYGSEPEVGPPSQATHWTKHAYNSAYWLTAQGMI